MRRSILLITFLILANSAVCFTATRTVISVSATTVVEGDQIRLADIATVSGDEATAARLKSLSLGYAPAIGAEREIQRSYLTLAIAATGVAEQAYSLEMPPRVVVRRAGQSIADGVVKAAVTQAVTERLNDPSVSVEIASIDFRDTAAVPMGEIEVKATVGAVRNFFAPFIVTVETRVDGRLVKTFPATVKVNASAEVLVAAHDLEANRKLTDSDAKLQRISIDQPITDYVRRPEMLATSQLVRPIAAGQPFTRSVIAAAQIIKTGDTVRIEGRSGRMVIVLIGEARANGRLGDRIIVKNKQSGATMQATVMAEGVVQVVL
jgi:flagella basal body P-ring formation protein FlgA